MTPSEPARGRLREMVASLLVIFAAQILKWQEPVSAAGEAVSRIASGLKKHFLFAQTPTSPD